MADQHDLSCPGKGSLGLVVPFNSMIQVTQGKELQPKNGMIWTIHRFLVTKNGHQEGHNVFALLNRLLDLTRHNQSSQQFPASLIELQTRLVHSIVVVVRDTRVADCF